MMMITVMMMMMVMMMGSYGWKAFCVSKYVGS